ncbi:MAG: ribonuclease D [Gammaproteobacteria bacterium]|jgi:ribonuclease D|nr:ribonuclease D [Gammaproteobacteria bacterium]
MPPSPAFPPLLVNQPEIDKACDEIEASPSLAIDTEFVRTRTYAPQLGLVQIAVNGLKLCVDPLSDADMSRMWALLYDPERSVILHSGKQDMEVLWFERGAVLGNLVDTQACAALLGYPAQIGYAGLVQELLGITVSKEQTRTDWTRRPLSDAQLSYAAEDVAHLHPLHELLRERLIAQDRYGWALEDSAALSDPALYEPDPDGAWQRIKSVPYLPGEQQARARALAAWREQQAVSLDKPRQWILTDAVLLDLAARDPQSPAALAALGDLPASVARKHGDALLAALAAGNELYAQAPEHFVQSTPDGDQEKARLKRLMQKVRAKAAELGMEPEVLASKRDINDMLRGAERCRVLNGWRSEIIGRELQAAA